MLASTIHSKCIKLDFRIGFKIFEKTYNQTVHGWRGIKHGYYKAALNAGGNKSLRLIIFLL